MTVQIPVGYKQTEVGVIPEDWKVLRLKDISPSQSVGLVINPSTYVQESGVVPMLVGSDIEENKINWEKSRRISLESNKSLPASTLDVDDLVVVRVGNPGIAAVVPKEIDGCNCASVMIIRRHERFESKWLSYLLNSSIGINQISNVQYGTAQKQFNISDAINFAYPFPQKKEQQAIAEALSDADALIESLEQLIAKKRQIKQGAMQALLTGQRRLPGFSGEWVKAKIGDFGQCLRGVSYRGAQDLYEYDSECTKRLLRSNNIKNSRVNILDLQFVDKERVSDYQILKPLDIVICMANGSKELVGKSALFEIDDGFDYTFGAFMGVFRVDQSVANAKFIHLIFQTEVYKIHVGNILAGSSINNLNPGSIESLEVLMPDLREQNEISNVTESIDTELDELREQLAKAQKIKQGMMQELLTGRIRLIQNP